MQGSAQAVSIGGEPSPPGRCCRRETGAEQYNVALPAALSGCRIPAHLPVRCPPLQRRVPGKTARLTGPPRRPFLAALSLTLSHSRSRFRVSAPRVNPGSELREARPPLGLWAAWWSTLVELRAREPPSPCTWGPVIVRTRTPCTSRDANIAHQPPPWPPLSIQRLLPATLTCPLFGPRGKCEGKGASHASPNRSIYRRVCSLRTRSIRARPCLAVCRSVATCRETQTT